jgi:hypothetical protein
MNLIEILYDFLHGGLGVLYPRVNRPEREADSSPPSGAKIKDTWGYNSTSPYMFMAWWLVKHRIHLHGLVLSYAQGQIYLYLTLDG